jgi:hypothetical protein
LKEEVLEMNFWTTVNSAEVESAMNDIVAKIQQHRENTLSSILSTIKEAVSQSTKNNSNICPALKKYAIPLDDTRVHANILEDLYCLNNTRHGTIALRCNLGDNKLSSFVCIPSSKNYRYMKKTNWLSSALAALGGPGRENESLLNLLILIGRTESYREVWEEGVKVTGLLLPKFDGLMTYAIQS